MELTGDIDDDASLPCDRRYRLRFNVVFAPGRHDHRRDATLVGDHETKGTLRDHARGAPIADAARDLPIVFTSERGAVRERRAPGTGAA
ncbi:MAG: hypothetical protein IPI43_13330 [Sandaracinaceae bacterium]|nr:hypothetical protein [Sandaracinaceae bacterium]